MFCQKCGAALPTRANFCPNCGFPTRTTQGVETASLTPAPNAAPPVETCIVNLRWQNGSGFVPAWFEADASGAGGKYIAGKSTTFDIIPGDAFWLNDNKVKEAHSSLVTEAGVGIVG